MFLVKEMIVGKMCMYFVGVFFLMEILMMVSCFLYGMEIGVIKFATFCFGA